MPGPAVGLGFALAALTAVALTAVVVKEVHENWDDLTHEYDAFADRVEDRHHISMPRFRQRPVGQDHRHRHHHHHQRHAAHDDGREGYGSRPMTTSFDRHDQRGGGRVYASGRDDVLAGSEQHRTSYHHHDGSEEDETDDSNRRTTSTVHHTRRADDQDDDDDAAEFREREDADFRAAVQASLLDLAIDPPECLDAYDVPDYPKEAVPASFQLVDPSSDFAALDRDDEDDDDEAETWSETWTVTDASERSEDAMGDDNDDVEAAFSHRPA